MIARFLLTILAASLAMPAVAKPVATARLVSCAAGECLLVTGRRASATDLVSINEQPIEAQGRASWRVRLPLQVVRDWSAPFARTLRVAVAGADGAPPRSEIVRLPVGLLGSRVELASLIVRAR